MKNNLKYIKYIITYVILNCFCISCDQNEILAPLNENENTIKNSLNDISLCWNASKSQIQDQMNDYILINSDIDFLQFTDKKNVIKLSYSFVNDSLQAIVAITPKLTNNIFLDYLDKHEYLGELSSKNIYYDTLKNTMFFSYDVLSYYNTEHSVIGFTPIISNLYAEDIIIKVDYKNLYYTIDDKPFKMIPVETEDFYTFYMMQTELPLLGEFKIGETFIGKIDEIDVTDNCITRYELAQFIYRINDATGLDFRLPTETEWKFAAKGGKASNNYAYSGSNNIEDVAWYNENSNKIQDIALKQPNELGFYDMSGNYAEVCTRVSGDPFTLFGKTYDYDPYNIDGNTYGGCWKYTADQCTPFSYEPGNTSKSKIPGTDRNELNAIDGRYISIRLVYDSPE